MRVCMPHRFTGELVYEPFPDEHARNRRQELVELPLFLRALGVRPGLRVLEVGCGRGVALPVVHRLARPSRLVGLDVDEELLAVAADVCGALGVELVAGDVRALPFDDASFDVVIDFGTLYHVGRPQTALSEISRVLAPGGIYAHETPISQLLSHPRRWGGRMLPWRAAPQLRRGRWTPLWAARVRTT